MRSFPSGSEIYEARFAEGLTYREMRAHFAVSARSSRFLAEVGEFVRADAALLALHPEFAAIDGAAALDIENPAYLAVREEIRAERMRGVGFAVLADRTGLPTAKLRGIVGEEVGTTARVAYGARYGSRKPTEEIADDAPTDAPTDDDAASGEEPTDAAVLAEADDAAALAEDSAPTATDAPTDAPTEVPAPTAPKRRRSRKSAPTATEAA